ncbi:MAG: tryptophan-rich sensory protein [Gemmatimonadetes bacterium]|nr:tryptophan-rich sensory protein [Gemmatimonadota bacterium]
MIVIAIVAWVVGVGAGGVLLTRRGAWYDGLRKPAWQPPDWLFGPAWTAIYLAAAWAWWQAWGPAAARPGLQLGIVVAFLANGLLNLGWSYLFFWRRRPDWALLEVRLLLVSIVMLIAVIAPVDRAAAWLIVPYLVWVGFASILNAALVRLNRPFAGTR